MGTVLELKLGLSPKGKSESVVKDETILDKIFMRNNNLINVIVLTAFMCFSCSINLYSSELKEYEDKAWSYLISGKTSLAIQEAEKVVAINEDSILGNIVLARSYYSWGLYDKSIKYAKKVLKQTTDYWVPYYLLGLSYKGKKMYGKARTYSTVYQIEPIAVPNLNPTPVPSKKITRDRYRIKARPVPKLIPDLSLNITFHAIIL